MVGAGRTGYGGDVDGGLGGVTGGGGGAGQIQRQIQIQSGGR